MKKIPFILPFFYLKKRTNPIIKKEYPLSKIRPDVTWFFEDNVELCPKTKIQLQELFHVYESISLNQQKKPAITKRLLQKELKRFFEKELTTGQIYIDSNNKTVICGLKVREKLVASPKAKQAK